MQVHGINNIDNKQSFNGQLKLNTQDMNVFDIALLKEHCGDMVEFVQKQKYDYVIYKQYNNQMYVDMEKNWQQINNGLVFGYMDKDGNRNIGSIFDTIKRLTKERSAIDKAEAVKPKWWQFWE